MYSAKAPGRCTPMPCGRLLQTDADGQPGSCGQWPQDDMPLGTDNLAGVEIPDVGADLDDAADKLVTDDQRHRDRPPRPGVPFVDVQIGAADAGAQNLDEDIVDADGFGTGASSSHRPGSDFFLMRAGMVFMTGSFGDFVAEDCINAEQPFAERSLLGSHSPSGRSTAGS